MAIKKNNFNKVKEKFSTSAKYKPQRFLDLGEDFLDAVGLPGPAIGHLNMFLGHSDTGKTTALLGAAADGIKKGMLPVFIITEQKFDFGHARIMGIPVEQVVDPETGEVTYSGPYIFKNDFDYIEQITDFMEFDQQPRRARMVQRARPVLAVTSNRAVASSTARPHSQQAFKAARSFSPTSGRAANGSGGLMP